MRGGRAHGAHLVEDDGDTGACRLPGGFGTGKAAADDMDGAGHRAVLESPESSRNVTKKTPA